MPDTTRTRSPLGSASSTATPPRLFRQLHHPPVGRAREPDHVGRLGGAESGPGERRSRAAADQHAGRTGFGAAQVQLVRRAQRGRETEGVREQLSFGQVGFLELQSREVVHP
ncbi:hypothetical protein [Lentzea albidocapillata]|uniref:hypothetical protein n=1 Tax=Lentzea albidocapillata TaxID=40571 RepID=UPI00210CE04E|nr:hypothetical protein [Lentzea albidocapillata]